MEITKESVPELLIGTGVVGTAAVALHSGKTLLKGVMVHAGTKPIALGSSPGVTYDTGYPLAIHELSPLIPIDDLSKLFVVGQAADSDYSFIAM